ncbi:hypothetical protein J1605_010279 [Eschrichtius robustus]|uniref:Uncharacterized protein n=1 Tax=Eschrichtius robustus TaxID=9764 RepID=A0AB34GUH3_ESCRO|nr:hypothetical protein J1605_010279 [Eschrichtius robustus]
MLFKLPAKANLSVVRMATPSHQLGCHGGSESPFRPLRMAEQAESIDNPLHEAAKRDIVEMLFTQPNIELNQQDIYILLTGEDVIVEKMALSNTGAESVN